jgi:hypothetical protein
MACNEIRQARLARLIRQPTTDVIALDRVDATSAGRLLAASGTSDIADAHVVICAPQQAASRHIRPRRSPQARSHCPVDHALTISRLPLALKVRAALAPGPALSMRRLGCGIDAGLRTGPDVLRQDDSSCWRSFPR